MSRAIFKYALPMDMDFSLDLPIGAQILTVQTQHERPTIWALVDPSDDAPVESRDFHIKGTGHPADDVGNYIGTFQLHGGALVFHLFESPKISIQ